MSELTASKISAANKRQAPQPVTAEKKAASHLRGEQVLSFTKPRKMINPRLVSLIKPHSIEAEQYRRLRQSVETFGAARKDPVGGVVVGLTSPLAGDGKTLTSINLAGSLAQDSNARVLLIELDLHQRYSNVKDYLGIAQKNGSGVVDKVLNKDIEWQKSVYYIPDFNLYVMPSGKSTGSSYEILKSEQLGEILTEARHNYDYIIVDTAPIVLLPDSQLISKWVDGFLMVVAADRTPRQMLEEAFNLMDGSKMMGLVFNECKPISDKYYQGYYG